MPSNRLHRGLVALSASAITAVYLAGYIQTQGADASIASGDPTAVPTAVVSAATAPTAFVTTAPLPTSTPLPRLDPTGNRGGPPVGGRPQPATPPTPVPTVAPITAPAVVSAGSGGTAVQQGQYKDGTFTGKGTSRRGDVQVSLTVTGGKIADVTITRTTTQYPVRVISNLPGQVVSRQSAQVDNVSGATYSSQAFKAAVSQALSQAKA